jgi:redox-sensitive bicupin YhaK (pirin superfamily)
MDEPIVFHYGPLLMNIMDEIQQAVEDYCAGQMVKAVS